MEPDKLLTRKLKWVIMRELVLNFNIYKDWMKEVLIKDTFEPQTEFPV